MMIYVVEIFKDLDVEAAMGRHLTSNRWEVTGSYTGYSTRSLPSRVRASMARTRSDAIFELDGSGGLWLGDWAWK